jgi:(4S)-4-hydroxy-5-phosphonooxypentane-2,3-dione isomerase
MTQPKFAIAVTFEIKPEFVEAFRVRILKQARDSIEKEPDCVQFDVLVDEADPSVFYLYETYADAAAFETHKQTKHFADYDRTVCDWVQSKSIRRLKMLEGNRA